jgi:hypothetical protein
MAAIPVYTDLILRRDTFMNDLRALAQEFQTTARNLSATAINVRVTLAVTAADLQRQLDAVQRQVRPIVVPVIYQPQGMPGGGGMGGGMGGGFPLGAASPNWGNYFGQLGQQIQGLGGGIGNELNRIAILTQAGLRGAAGGGGAGAGGGAGGTATRYLFGQRVLGSMGLLAGAHFAARYAGDVAEEVGMGMEGANLGRMRDPMDQLKRKRQLIEGEHAGLRGGVNWIYGKLGLQPTYDEETRTLDEAERADQLADQREKAARRAAAERTRTREMLFTMGREATRAEGGGIAGRRADITDALRKHEEAAQHIEDAWQTLGYKTYQDAQRVAGQIRVAGRRIAGAQQDAVNRAEFGMVAQSGLAIQETSRRASLMEMRAAGRGTEAGYTGQVNTINDRLQRLGIAYQSEADPEKRALLGQQYQAELLARPREIGAIQAGIRRETTEDIVAARRQGFIADLQGRGADRQAALYARNSAIDVSLERLRRERDAAPRGTFVRSELEARYTAESAAGGQEKAANVARDARQREDQVNAINEQAGRARLSMTRNSLTEELRLLDDHYNKRIQRLREAGENEEADAMERARRAQREAVIHDRLEGRGGRLAQARDALLRSRGRGGLAEELDIEDELRRDLRSAQGDPGARRAAVQIARSRLQAYVNEQNRPQFFGSNQEYVRSIQMGVFNQDAEGLRRAMKMAGILKGNQGAIGAGAKIPGEDDLGFGLGPEDFKQFGDGADKLNQAADKMLNNPIGVIRR